MECGENEAVYFQSQQRTLSTGMVSYNIILIIKTAALTHLGALLRVLWLR
jgi:hypothetical protein